MSNEVYPVLPGLTYGTTRSYGFDTAVQRNVSGRRVSESLRSTPLRTWTLGYEFLREKPGKTELQTLLGFFFRHYGRFDTFLFEDPRDNTATGMAFGTGTGANLSYQLRRTYGLFYENIQSPKVVSAVRIDGVTVDPADYTVDYGTGIITFDTPPADTLLITADFTYYWRAAFADDEFSIEEFVKLFFECRRLRLEQVIV